MLREELERLPHGTNTGTVYLSPVPIPRKEEPGTNDHRLRNYIEFLLENYPRLCVELELCRDVDSERRHRLEVVCSAIRDGISLLPPEDVKLLRIVYIAKSHSVEGAGLIVHLSKSEAYRRINAIIDDIAERIGEK